MNYYTSEELEWLRINYPLVGSHACAKYLNRPLSSVRQTANKLGQKVSRKLMNKLASNAHIKNFIPTISPELFDNVNTKEAAYVLGMLWADGWITTKNYYAVNIKLIQSDFAQIIPIFNKLGRWKQYDYAPIGRRPTTQLVASGKPLTDLFLSMDYHIKSSVAPTKVLAKIPRELKEYWWRGYFDGDGHIKITSGYSRLEISAACNQDWTFLPEDIPFKIYVVNGEHSYSKVVLSSKKNILAFGELVWNHQDGIGLSRKYNQFKKLIDAHK